MENMFPTESGNSSPPKRGRSLLTTNQDENSDVKWVKIREMEEYSNEEHMKVIFRKIVEKIR